MYVRLSSAVLFLTIGACALGCNSGATSDGDGGSGDMGISGLRPTGFPEVPSAPVLTGHTLNVGAGKTYSKPCAALTAAVDGDTIAIDAGTYSGDTCIFAANNLYIHGVGGRAVLDISGVKPAGCKGLWVVDGKDVLIEDVEFSGAHLRPTDSFVQNGTCTADKNGAGIRWEGGNLTLRRCSLHDNDDGILGGNDPQAAILIEYSEFRNNSFDGFSHNLYINQVAELFFRYNYSSHTNADGHLLKSRARKNVLLYNRFTGEDSMSSYEINLPNGGESYVIGNIIQQGPATGNAAMLDYASEGLGPSFDNHIYIVNNTFVSQRAGGATFMQLNAATSTQSMALNNICMGAGSLTSGPTILQMANLTQDPLFVNAAMYDYTLQAGSPAIAAGVDPGQVGGIALTPVNEYVHTASAKARPQGAKLDVGAFQFSP